MCAGSGETGGRGEERGEREKGKGEKIVKRDVLTKKGFKNLVLPLYRTYLF